MVELKTPYFKKNVKWLLFLGIDIHPVQNPWYKYFLYKLYAVFVIGFVITYGLLEVVDVLNTSDFNSMTFGLCYCATHILGIGKILILLVKKNKIRDMITRLETGRFKPDMERGGEEEFNLVNAAVARCIKHSEIVNSMVYSVVSIRCLYAFFDNGNYEDVFDERLNATVSIHKRTLPYSIWLPFDTSSSPIYEIVFILQPATLIIYGYYLGLLDTLVYGMMIHMNSQFFIIRCFMQRQVDMAKNKVTKINQGFETSLSARYERIQILDAPVQNEIKKIVHDVARHHILILDFCDEIENEFSYMLLTQFLFTLYTLAFQLYQLSLMDNILSFDSISMCVYLTLLMYQIFCYCYYSNAVMISSEEFSQFLYNSDWLLFDNSIKKSLLLMMMRAQRPIKFTVGKFALLSLATFMAVVRGSGSYFMVLQQVTA